jgi:DNA-binding LacI/PurR family transcriptional regulator
MRVRTRLSAVALGALLASSSVALAQQPSPPSTGDQSKRTQNIPEDKLDAAGAALAAVSRVHQDYQKRIAAAASPDDKKRIVEEANKALERAITDKGLSIDEYNAIVDVAQNDPEFKAKLIQRARGILSQ